jgi:hypothetical protein
MKFMSVRELRVDTRAMRRDLNRDAKVALERARFWPVQPTCL